MDRLTGLGVDDAQLAVGGQHDRLPLRAALEGAEPVGRAEVDLLLLAGAGVEQADHGAGFGAVAVLGLGLTIGQDDRRILTALEVAGALSARNGGDLVELPVAVDHGPVLAAEGHNIALLGRLSDGLAVHARAVLRLGGDLAVLVLHLHGGALILRALRGQQSPVGQRDGHPVVRGVGLRGDGGAEVAIGEGRRVHDRDLPGFVREESGALAVGHHMARVRGLDGDVGDSGLLLEEVLVVAVGLLDEAGVVGGELLTVREHDVTAVAGGVEADIAVELLGAEDLAALGVDGGHAAVMCEHDTRGQRGDLSFLGGRRLRACAGAAGPGVGSARRGGSGAAAGKGEGKSPGQSNAANFPRNGSHWLHSDGD